MRAMTAMTGLAASLALAAVASPGAAVPNKGQQANDPNREICKSQGTIGSRLKRVRVCMTAQEWEELEFQEQLGLRRKQFNGDPGCPQPPCTVERGGKDTPW